MITETVDSATVKENGALKAKCDTHSMQCFYLLVLIKCVVMILAMDLII
jgi:hypothetical protein